MISRDLCKPHFQAFPPWRCPACDQGSLVFDFKNLRRWPSKGTVWAVEEGYQFRGDEGGVFSALLKCSNYACYQGVAVLGDYSSAVVDSNYTVETVYTVRDIHPAIAFIAIPKAASETIKDALQRAFVLYWRDPQSCAGALRTVMEGIADRLGEPAKQNGKFVALGKRLEKMKTAHPDLVNAAEVIKDVGNDGAHGGPVDQAKLLDVFELLEIELRSIFNDDATRRQVLISQIRTMTDVGQ
jgi:hypothetical protein